MDQNSSLRRKSNLNHQQNQTIELSERASIVNSNYVSINNICSPNSKGFDALQIAQSQNNFKEQVQEKPRPTRNSIVNLIKLSKIIRKTKQHTRINNLNLFPLKTESNSIKNSSVAPEEKKTEGITHWNVLQLLHIIRRFVSKIKMQSAFQSYQHLTKQHFTLIKDQASFYQKPNETILNYQQNKVNTSRFYLLIHKLNRDLKKIKAFHPDSTFILTFRIIFLLFLLIQLFQVPLQMSFLFTQDEGSHNLQNAFTIISIILCFADCLVKFNTAYYDEVILIAHVCGCAFHKIAQWELKRGETNTWLHAQKIDMSPWEIRYLYALYYTFITQATVGYGDITPTTPIEKMYTIIVTLISCGQFGYVINTIGQIFLESAQKQASYKQKKFEIANYMRQREISSQLQIQVFKYLDYIQGKECDEPKKGQEILESVSQKLKQDVYRDFFGQKLRSSKLFTINFSNDCINDLSLRFKEVLYGPGEVIYTAGELDSRIFFIVKGGVELYIQNQLYDNFIASKVENGDFFGQIGFFTGMHRDTNARSTKVSHLIYCSSEEFQQVLKQYPQDYEQFCMMKDDMIMQKKLIHITCLACQKFNHSIIDCPMMHFVKSREYVVQKYNYSQEQKERQSTLLRLREKYKTLSENDKVKIALKIIRHKYIKKARRLKEQNMNKQQQQESDSSDRDGNDKNNSSQVNSDQNEYSISNSLQEQIIQRQSDKYFFKQNPCIFVTGELCQTVESQSYSESSFASSEEEDYSSQNQSQSEINGSNSQIQSRIDEEDDEGEEVEEDKEEGQQTKNHRNQQQKKLSNNFPFEEIADDLPASQSSIPSQQQLQQQESNKFQYISDTEKTSQTQLNNSNQNEHGQQQQQQQVFEVFSQSDKLAIQQNIQLLPEPEIIEKKSDKTQNNLLKDVLNRKKKRGATMMVQDQLEKRSLSNRQIKVNHVRNENEKVNNNPAEKIQQHEIYERQNSHNRKKNKKKTLKFQAMYQEDDMPNQNNKLCLPPHNVQVYVQGQEQKISQEQHQVASLSKFAPQNSVEKVASVQNKMKSRKSISVDSMNYLFKLQNNKTCGSPQQQQPQQHNLISNISTINEFNFNQESTQIGQQNQNESQKQGTRQISATSKMPLTLKNRANNSSEINKKDSKIPQLEYENILLYQQQQQQQLQNKLPQQEVARASQEISTNHTQNILLQRYSYKQIELLFIPDFDKMREYKFYFPHNNYSVVCKRKDNKKNQTKKQKQVPTNNNTKSRKKSKQVVKKVLQ